MQGKKFLKILLITLLYHLVYASSLSICQRIIQSHNKNSSVKSQEYKNLLEELKTTLYDKCILELQPKYVWAQNMSFIMVKFDFQISSRTSCSKLILSEKKVGYQGFQLKHYCLQSNKLIKYRVDINTYKNLNPHFSKWKDTQMNGVILQALKSPAPYFWPKLYSQSVKVQTKPKIWWQLQQKQDQTVQKYMGLLEIDESQVQVSSYVKKMKKRTQKNKKSSPSQIQFYCNQGSPFLIGSWL